MKHALFLLRRLPAYDRGYLPRVAALAVLAGLTPLLGIVFPKLIFDELLGLRRVPWLMLWVALLAGGGWLFAMAKAWLTKGRDAGNERTFIGLQQELYQKADRLSLEKSERKSTLDLVERSTYGQYALYELMQTLEPLGGAALSLILSFGILISGDGWLLLILTAMSLRAIPSARRQPQLRLFCQHRHRLPLRQGHPADRRPRPDAAARQADHGQHHAHQPRVLQQERVLAGALGSACGAADIPCLWPAGGAAVCRQPVGG